MSSRGGVRSTDIWMESDSIVASQPATSAWPGDRHPFWAAGARSLAVIEDVVLDSRGDSISYAALSSGDSAGHRNDSSQCRGRVLQASEKDAYVPQLKKRTSNSVSILRRTLQIRTPYWAEYAGRRLFPENNRPGRLIQRPLPARRVSRRTAGLTGRMKTGWRRSVRCTARGITCPARAIRNRRLDRQG